MLENYVRLEMFTKFLLTVSGVMYSQQLLYAKNTYSKIFGAILLLTAVYFMFNRDFYLPFLGRCAMPPSLIKKVPVVKVDSKIPVKLTNLPPNTQIMYWASIPSNEIINDPMSAYENYTNSGTTMSNEMGEAFARVDCPSNYAVGLLKMKLRKHIHYRYALPQYKGLYSRVFTANVEC